MKILLLALIFLLGACAGAGPHAVKDATVRDTIYAIETKENGSHFLWMRYDDVGVYCTMDTALFNKAVAIFDDKTREPVVFIKYISSNLGSEENKNFFQDPLGIAGCKHSEATVYVITDIQSANGE